MKAFPFVIAGVSLALVLFGAFASRLDILALGATAFIGSLAWLGMQASRGAQSALGLDAVSNENRVLIAPLVRLHGEMEEIIRRNAANPAVKVIGREAFDESRRILENAVRALSLRDELTKARKGRYEAQKELAQAEKELASATSEGEKRALGAAIEARKREIAHYNEADRALEKISVALKQSEAALSELKARLLVASARSEAVEDSNAELSETVNRLKTLSASFDEAEALAREVNA